MTALEADSWIVGVGCALDAPLAPALAGSGSAFERCETGDDPFDDFEEDDFDDECDDDC
ncbi:MAG TPA: hypothetical protein PJ982_14665 [Lacipirellulaceae bacterium]|nr:hypothetical protein [Lacipirellulaceae bacterium]